MDTVAVVSPPGDADPEPDAELVSMPAFALTGLDIDLELGLLLKSSPRQSVLSRLLCSDSSNAVRREEAAAAAAARLSAASLALKQERSAAITALSEARRLVAEALEREAVSKQQESAIAARERDLIIARESLDAREAKLAEEIVVSQTDVRTKQAEWERFVQLQSAEEKQVAVEEATVKLVQLQSPQLSKVHVAALSQALMKARDAGLRGALIEHAERTLNRAQKLESTLINALEHYGLCDDVAPLLCDFGVFTLADLAQVGKANVVPGIPPSTAKQLRRISFSERSLLRGELSVRVVGYELVSNPGLKGLVSMPYTTYHIECMELRGTSRRLAFSARRRVGELCCACGGGVGVRWWSGYLPRWAHAA